MERVCVNWGWASSSMPCNSEFLSISVFVNHSPTAGTIFPWSEEENLHECYRKCCEIVNRSVRFDLFLDLSTRHYKILARKKSPFRACMQAFQYYSSIISTEILAIVLLYCTELQGTRSKYRDAKYSIKQATSAISTVYSSLTGGFFPLVDCLQSIRYFAL